MGKMFGIELNADQLDGQAARLSLVLDGYMGGSRGARTVMHVLDAGVAAAQAEGKRADQLEVALEFAQASIRAFVGDGPVPVADPPKGHRWLTADDDSTGPRLYCATCAPRSIAASWDAATGDNVSVQVGARSIAASWGAATGDNVSVQVRATSAAECLAASR